MSVVGSQQQTFLRLLRALRPHWHRDVALPARIQALLARHKEFGSRDRRLYRELIYTTIRYLPWIEPLLDTDPPRAAKIAAWLAAETRDTKAFRAELCGDWPQVESGTDVPPVMGNVGDTPRRLHGQDARATQKASALTLAQRAAFLGADPQVLLPGWLRPERPELFSSPELDAQLSRAPLWIRLQTEDSAAVAAEFEAKGWRWHKADVRPTAWQVLADADVTKTEAFARGMIEVQDLGSQLVLESAGIASGGRWLDACAGAGGKTLQLARLLGPGGRVEAQDIREAALEELKVRARRAAATNIVVVAAPNPGGYDGVLVDAPCSGSGTWRRAPHLKWTTTPEFVGQRAALQLTLLRQYATAVNPGGRLVYATCSLAPRENEAVVAAFLDAHRNFEPVPPVRSFGFAARPEGLTILPSRHDTDGFFVASLARND
jgi:16S rRNA (cytosine967-C5)-methyltransferase